MRELRYRIVNVFTVDGARLSGNALCVVEDGSGLDEQTMQALARQFNLSETTFLLPASGVDARVRIFTPTIEMPFAGHPTLGSAHVVRALGGGDRVALSMKAGVVQVTADGDRWTLKAARAPETRAPSAGRGEIAAMLGLDEVEVSGPPLWVDTGAEQLVVPLASVEAVRAARPRPELLERHGRSERAGESMAYVWARGPGDAVEARFFFTANGSVVEDPATGSACANLGGYLIATGAALPARARIDQGAQAGRPSRLDLLVDGERGIFVTGEVIALGGGSLHL